MTVRYGINDPLAFYVGPRSVTALMFRGIKVWPTFTPPPIPSTAGQPIGLLLTLTKAS